MAMTTAYEAFWFLHDHPKMKAKECRLVDVGDVPQLRKAGATLRKVKDDMPWCKGKSYVLEVFRAERHALECNLSIFWAKVDARGNSTKRKSGTPECWLEFGPLEWAVSEGHCYLKHYHDVNLDCGAATFDEALIKLAKLVKKYYGPKNAR